MNNYTIIIPARLGSTRFPKKLLKPLAGKPILQWTFEQAKKTNAQDVYIAVDSDALYDVARALTPNVLMTKATHPTGTDRLCEAATLLQLPADHIVVNVQGDEPFIPPLIIDQVAANLASHPQAEMATLYKPFTEEAAIQDPNQVKVVIDKQGFALYFSRAPIPFVRDAQVSFSLQQAFHHIGIYAYRVGFLQQFVQWAPAPLEISEQLEQLRALWYGAKVHVDCAKAFPAQDINTEADWEKAKVWIETISKNVS